MKYRQRIVDKTLKEKLTTKGAVLIEGSKWCGKTTTAKQQAKSVVFMHDPNLREQYMELSKIAPSLLLSGETPVLIDEWQVAPNLWDAVRFEVDQRNQSGQFILTGSAVPLLTENQHSGIGRITRLMMRPMSLFESGDSKGSVSLKELFNHPKELASKNEYTLENIAYFLCRGGWPYSIDQDVKTSLRHALDYYEGIVESEISRADGVKREKRRAERILKSYARNIATQVKMSEILKDIQANEADTFDIETLSLYLNALKLIYVIEDLPAWSPNIRSKTAIRTTDTRHFVDPSIAVAALGLNPSSLLKDLKTFGYLFESMCIRDLRVYAESNDGKVYHYRDAAGLEADAIIQLKDGRYALIEVKLGNQERIEEAATNLLKLKDKIDTEKMREPSFMMVLTATNYAYRRSDGIYVVPITCLKD